MDDPALPPYSFVPDGPWPHPRANPRGHSHGRPLPRAHAIEDDRWQESASYARGCALFNKGYYWEAHEEWEALWHAHGRHGPAADFLKALIKLAAAGVKIRQRQPHGVRIHAARAAGLLQNLIASGIQNMFGLDVTWLHERARGVCEEPPGDPLPREAPVSRVFAFALEPGA